MKPILRTRSITPSLRVKGRAIIEGGWKHRIGEPIGLLLTLTYGENIPLWITLDNFSAPKWGFIKNLTSPSWAK